MFLVVVITHVTAFYMVTTDSPEMARLWVENDIPLGVAIHQLVVYSLHEDYVTPLKRLGFLTGAFSRIHTISSDGGTK